MPLNIEVFASVKAHANMCMFPWRRPQKYNLKGKITNKIPKPFILLPILAENWLYHIKWYSMFSTLSFSFLHPYYSQNALSLHKHWSFNKQSHGDASIGKLVETHLAPGHNTVEICHMLCDHCMFLSMVYLCKGIWGLGVCLG